MTEKGLPAFAPDHPVLNTPAVWHGDAGVPRDGWAVVLMRRAFELPAAMKSAALWVSASQRFILYLDGRVIARGPSRSDPMRWGVARVTLPPLSAGPHVLAAEVVHFGRYGGIGQLGGPGFFLVCPEHAARTRGAGSAATLGALATGPGWRCVHDVSRAPLEETAWGEHRPYFVVGAGQRTDAAKAVRDWAAAGFDDSSWPEAKVLCRGVANEWGNFPLGCWLRPDPLPAMEEREEHFARVAEADASLADAASEWVKNQQSRGVSPRSGPTEGPFASLSPLTIAPNSQVRILLDRGELTNAYPVLTVSGGRGAVIRLVYAEAPIVDRTWLKGNRDETAGKHIWGQLDEFLPDGRDECTFTPLWFRAFRYVELRVATAAEPLALDRFTCVATAYPLRLRARFAADAARREAFDSLWDISFRTARLCAHETFFDCPHYEQAQFPGDSRVQAVYHYLVAGDDRLARKAIDDFHASRLPEGLTQCRYPSKAVQVLPTFSLYWIGMMHDFRVYRGDGKFLEPYLPFAREVLGWFLRRLRPDGLLGRVGHAPFVDWTPAFKAGNAPQDPDGGSAILTLLLARACRWQADLERAGGFAELAPRWRRQAARLARTVLRTCWDAGRALLADTPAHASYSQHAQVEAILAGAWPAAKAGKVLARALHTEGADIAGPGTFYYRYYVMQALKAAGMRAEFFAQLGRWERLLDGTALTTWPESDSPTSRSDCHAWSVAPAIEFLQTVLGVEPDPGVDGFARVRFAPELGPLREASGTVPTPHGEIRVRLRRTRSGGTQADLDSPVPVIPDGRKAPLKAGKHRLVI
jgi:hypothetical protein